MTTLHTLLELVATAALVGLASYRATQLAVHDTILDPVRDRVLAWQDRRPDSAARVWTVTLISCIYCTGWWVSGAMLAVFLLAADRWHGTPLLIHGIQWFAVAGVQSLLNRWDDTRPEAAA
ncbi:MAG TPA: DUF1360 domain-containing protein [Streptomyces sp.]|nr:DUF1360 domain-containing protein [Streptomyces sp.]